jgi:hypothetical protein
MDIFVLGKRAAQWLSEQLLGPRRTRAEPVAPRLWRGPGGIVCNDSQCSWECRRDTSGLYRWQLIMECPDGCNCISPVSVCDISTEGSRVTADCQSATDSTTTSTSTTNTTTDTTTTAQVPCDQMSQAWCDGGVCRYHCEQVNGVWRFVLHEAECDYPDCCVCPEIVEDLHEICRCQPDYIRQTGCIYPYTECKARGKGCEWRCIEIEPCRFSWVRHYDCYCPSWRCDPPGPPCHLFVVGARVETPCYLTPPSTTTTTTTTPRACLWSCSFGVYSLVDNTCGQPECCCSPPEQPCPPDAANQLIQVPCNCPSPPPPPRCSDNCTWICVSSGEAGSLVWGLREFNCDAAAGCICDPPSPITCSLLGDVTSTPCYRPDQTSSTTTSGTTTTAEPCSQHVCKWKCVNQDGRFFWQRIEHCPQGCLCNDGVPPPEEDCVCATVGQVRAFGCHPPTTTTTTSEPCWWYTCTLLCATDAVGNYYWDTLRRCPTGCECITDAACNQYTVGTILDLVCSLGTTTTTSSTTTTDTTTSQDCWSLYCVASCQDDGQGNYYWQVLEPCPSGCHCRPDWYLICDETNPGQHAIQCDF